LSIEDIPVPTPGPGEVLIKVVASGVCHTDLHAAEGDWPAKPELPFVPGHEGAGIIAASARAWEGDHAGVAWLHDACGQCEYCMSGWDSLCHAQHNTGYSVNGSFAEYVIGAAPEGHHQPGRSAARGVSDAYLRCGHEPHHDSRFHRGRP
jgi:alcohol dehydrogenase, propanol-preferring